MAHRMSGVVDQPKIGSLFFNLGRGVSTSCELWGCGTCRKGVILCSLINTQPWQLQENEMLHRMSHIGLVLILTVVGALNSAIVFLF